MDKRVVSAIKRGMFVFRPLTIFLIVTHLFLLDDIGYGDWKSVEGDRVPVLIETAQASLATHWKETERGWCRAIVANGAATADLCWDMQRSGLELHPIAGIPESTRPRMPVQDLIACYSPTEVWTYRIEQNEVSGTGIDHGVEILFHYDGRQHSIWLGASVGTLVDRFNKMAEQSPLVEESSDGLLRFETDNEQMVFDVTKGFSPVLYEHQMKREKLKYPDRAYPLRQEYDLAQDSHGIWYCRRMVRTFLGSGGKDQDHPQVIVGAEILEYDSQPPPEKMRLEYKSLGIPDGTPVESLIPKKMGRWVYGKAAARPIDTDGPLYQSLGEKMRSRGFAKSKSGAGK